MKLAFNLKLMSFIYFICVINIVLIICYQMCWVDVAVMVAGALVPVLTKIAAVLDLKLVHIHDRESLVAYSILGIFMFTLSIAEGAIPLAFVMGNVVLACITFGWFQQPKPV